MTSRHACAPTNCWPRRSSLTGDHHDHAPVAPHVDARYDAAARGARGHQEDGLGRGRAAPPRLRARGQGRPVRRASADAGARLGPPGGLRGGGARLAVGHRGGARAAAARVRRAGRARKGARLCHDHEPGGPRARGRGRRGAEHPRGRRHRARARSAPGRRVQLPVRAAQRPGPDARGDGAGRPSPDRAPARHVPPRAHRRLAARDRGRAAGGDRLRAVQRRAAHRPRAGQGARPPAAGAGERAVPGVLRRVRPAGLHRLRELRGAQPRRVEAPGRGRGARGAGRDARRDAVTRVWPVVGLLLLTIGRAVPVAAAPEGELTWAVHVSLAPTWFDPAETPGVIVPFMVLYALHDALAKPMPGAPMAPSLAESWSVSPDGLVYDFVLRVGVRFHNGDPVAAEDVKFSLERYRGGAAATLKARVAAVEVVDARHVRIRLKQPWPDFMTFYATPATGAAWIVPKRYVERVGEDGFKKAPIGAGPYRFVSFTPGIELVLEAFDGYWRKSPAVKRLVFRSVPDESTRLAMLKRGEADIAYAFR